MRVLPLCEIEGRSSPEPRPFFYSSMVMMVAGVDSGAGSLVVSTFCTLMIRQPEVKTERTTNAANKDNPLFMEPTLDATGSAGKIEQGNFPKDRCAGN
jgi:hypothetical protein